MHFESCFGTKAGIVLNRTSLQIQMLKTTFSPERSLETLLTGRSIAIYENNLLAINHTQVTVLNLHSNTTSNINLNVEIAHIATSKKYLVVALQNLQIIVYILDRNSPDLSPTVHKSFKAHEAPVLSIDFDPTGSLFATGSADSTVKVWDVVNGHCTHNFKGHSGIISVVKFHPNPRKLLLASASDDCKIMIWDLMTREQLAVFDSQ